MSTRTIYQRRNINIVGRGPRPGGGQRISRLRQINRVAPTKITMVQTVYPYQRRNMFLPRIQENLQENQIYLELEADNFWDGIEGQRNIWDNIKENYFRDKQNSHDPQIVSKMDQIWSKINNGEKIPEGKMNNTLERIKKKYNDPEISNLMDYIRKINARIEKLNVSEKEIFYRTWKYLENKNNPELWASFGMALQESWNKGNIVCMLGRFGRIMSSFLRIDPDMDDIDGVAPEAYVQNEIQSRGGVLWNEISHSREILTEEEIEKFEFEEDPIIREKVTNEVLQKLKEEYINTGLVNKIKFQKYTEWIKNV